MYLFGAFISGWVKRRKGKIVVVEIVIVTVIVLLSGWGEAENILEWMCAGDGGEVGGRSSQK